MTILNDTCDNCGAYIDPIGGDNARSGGAMGMADQELLFCSRQCGLDFNPDQLVLADTGCMYCGAGEFGGHEPGCYLFEDD